ncbi:manganese transporter [Psittacicella melopsittaci]|uniref:Manganese transporter n=1 Tax=Psittacicella melopsittaci TaxID=2028576 RepID=A0A3A1Y7Y0_9GAMM|nr:metal ABC transporter ATP-binding protein [Psittacicella melopsittaci]RIY33350.1 manganese transporter [Psittacicella melopsittaci]
MTYAIAVQDLNLIYPNGHQALIDVNFNLESGSVCALIGMNGSGKSTLFKSILNLEKVTTGKILVSGKPVAQAIQDNLIAYVPQIDAIDYDFPISVYEVIMQGRYAKMNFMRHAKAEDKAIVQQVAQRMQIEPLLKRQIGELSGGQKKRVFIARALAQQAQIILLDEPFTGVDIKTEDQIIRLLPELAQEGKTILISTHNLERITDYCDKTLMIYRTVLFFGKTSEVFNSANIEATFNPAVVKN